LSLSLSLSIPTLFTVHLPISPLFPLFPLIPSMPSLPPITSLSSTGLPPLPPLPPTSAASAASLLPQQFIAVPTSLLQSLPNRQQSESNSCVGTPLPFFQPDFSLQLNPLAQSPFPSSVYQSGVSTLPSMGIAPRRTGGRRPKEMDNLYDDNMDHEEVEKKSKRRLRNKEAAARCRQRRLNLMQELQEKVDQFKRESKSKADEIKNLSEKVNRLQTFLRNHECKVSIEERQKILNNCAVAQNIPMMQNTRYISAPQQSRALPPPSLPSHQYLPTSTHSQIEQPVENFPAQLRANQPRDSTDWIPQYEQHRGTKRGHEEMNGGGQFNEIKQPKMEVMDNEKTLTQINGRDDIERPFEIKMDLSAPTGSGPIPLTTPSRDFGAPTFSNFPMPSFGMSSGLSGPANILGQTTGLTPIANVSAMSAFPLGTPLGNNDLKNL
ncbi:hypothetical protein PFISCL1PPCAC_1842, partial [Pristionchus fissidentatus]